MKYKKRTPKRSNRFQRAKQWKFNEVALVQFCCMTNKNIRLPLVSEHANYMQEM